MRIAIAAAVLLSFLLGAGAAGRQPISYLSKAQAPSAGEPCSRRATTPEQIACLERSIDTLRSEMAQLKAAMPRLVDAAIKKALEPKLHRGPERR